MITITLCHALWFQLKELMFPRTQACECTGVHKDAYRYIYIDIYIYIHRNVDTHKEKEGPLY